MMITTKMLVYFQFDLNNIKKLSKTIRIKFNIVYCLKILMMITTNILADLSKL